MLLAMKSLNYVTVKDTGNRNTTNSVILQTPVSLMRFLPVLNQVENGTPLRKTNLSVLGYLFCFFRS